MSISTEIDDMGEGSLRELAGRVGLEFIETVPATLDPEVFEALPADKAAELKVAPLSLAGRRLKVAVSDPLNLELESRLAALTGHRIDLCVAPRAAIEAALRRSETSRRVLDNVSEAFRPQIVSENAKGDETVVDLVRLQDQDGIVRLTNSILLSALERGASDIHIEASQDQVEVKYRIDGVLAVASSPIAISHHGELVSRIKIMAELDIAERRMPQDGRFRLRIEGRDIDFRVSILPTQFGEDVVIRVLDKSAFARTGQVISLSELGFDAEDIEAIRRAVRLPYGLVLMTGPTGSGKTTTLYGALSEMAMGSEKIITIEDPIEYELPGVVQIAVHEKRGMTFSSGLRSILRHDPDRIMVGEIRDLETATIAVQAALTGHLVLASVHANSSFDVISRFAHWGLDLHDFVSALNAVFAQRLLRGLCPACATETQPPEGLGAQGPAGSWRAPVGCPECFDTGYAGRFAVMEHLDITGELAELMIARVPASRLRAASAGTGSKTLRAAALDKAAAGLTSFDEVLRTTVET